MNLHKVDNHFAFDRFPPERDGKKRADLWISSDAGYLPPEMFGPTIEPHAGPLSQTRNIGDILFPGPSRDKFILPEITFQAKFQRSSIDFDPFGTVFTSSDQPFNLKPIYTTTEPVVERRTTKQSDFSKTIGLSAARQDWIGLDRPFTGRNNEQSLSKHGFEITRPTSQINRISRPSWYWDMEDFGKVAGLFGALGDWRSDSQLRAIGRPLSYLSFDPLKIASDVAAHTGFAAITPILEVMGPITSLVSFAQSSSIYRLPLATFDSTTRHAVLFRNSLEAPGHDFNPYRDRYLEDVVVHVQQPGWRNLLAGFTILGSGLLTVAAPMSGAIFMGAGLGDRLAGMVRLQVPKGMQLPSRLTWDEINQVQSYTDAYIRKKMR